MSITCTWVGIIIVCTLAQLSLSSPPSAKTFAAGRAEGGGAHRHRDADCGTAQAANQRLKPQGELRASASRPLVQRLHDSPDILMRDTLPPARTEAH